MAIKTWDGGAATDLWNLADNWDSNLPTTGDDIQIAVDSGQRFSTARSPLTSLTIATLTSGSNVTVSGCAERHRHGDYRR